MRLILSLFLILASSAVWACGPDTDCVIGDRHYRISGADNARNGAIVFAHGYRGSAKGIMKNMNLRKMVDDMGLALIAVKSFRDDWAIPNAPGDYVTDGALEYSYFEAVLKDARMRFDLNAERVMMSGFSAGGMMVWELACHRPDLFAGFAPIAGTFWKEPPKACAEPTSIVHIHGTSDRTVPLEGRQILQTKQGSVPATLDMYRGFGAFKMAQTVRINDMDCTRETNAAGHILEFCTHAGGHSFKRSYLRYAWDRLTAAGQF